MIAAAGPLLEWLGMRCLASAVLLCALSAAGDETALRPAWEPGARSRVEIEVEDRAEVRHPPVELSIETEWEIRYVETVERVDEGRPVSVTRAFERHRKVERRKGEGRRPRVVRDTGPEGEELYLRAGHDGRVIEPMGEVEPGFAHGLDWNWVLPTGPVERGASWTVEGGWDLAELFPRLVAATVHCRYEKRRGRRAVITARAGPEDAPTFEATVEFDTGPGGITEAQWTERDAGPDTRWHREGRFERKMLE